MTEEITNLPADAPKLVSVLVACALATHTLRLAVQSILDSDLARQGKVEVIVAPDDGFHGYADILAGLPGCIVLEPTKFAGPGLSRNRAFAAATGQWITMLDADDWVLPDYLDKLMAAVGDDLPCAFARTRYECNGTMVRMLEVEGDHLEAGQFAAFGGSIHALVHRRIWEPYPDGVGEDVFVDASALHAAGGMAPLTDAVYVVSLHGSSMCARIPQLRFNDDYRKTLIKEARTTVLDVFAAKLAFGLLYEQHCAQGGVLDFHGFMATIHAASRPQGGAVAQLATPAD